MAKSKLEPGSPAGSSSDSQVATQPQGSVATYHENTDYDSPNRDMIIPKLAIVNSTGPLAAKFRADYGKLVFEGRLILGEEASVIPLKLSKYYVECRRAGVDLKFADEKKIFKTANQAHQAGYAIEWDSKHTDKVEEAATITFLVAGPESDPGGAFFIKVGEKFYAPAVMSFRRGGYRDVYRQLFTSESRSAMQGRALWHSAWTLFVKPDCTSQHVDNTWAEARIKPLGKLTDVEIANLAKAAVEFGGRAVKDEAIDV